MKRTARGRSSVGGFSLFELVIDLAIVGIVCAAVAVSYSTITRKSVASTDKEFATQKAMQLIQELQWAASAAGPDAVSVLDNLDDHDACNLILTTAKDVVTPEDPLSGNTVRKYCRTISVTPMSATSATRQVSIKVMIASNRSLLADSYAVIQAPSKTYATAQVYDIYVLNIEAQSYGWKYRSSLYPMKSMMSNMINDLQSRRPGFEARVHWITRMSYGRDPYYTPLINSNLAVTQNGALPRIYFYPGKVVPAAPPASQETMYYDPKVISGRLNVDGTFQNGTPGSASQPSYSLTDQFNHAVRYPEEIALFNGATTYAAANNLPRPELSWRMLIEQMNSNPASFKNIVLINLHGESIPLPAMHNYSDAAKAPDTGQSPNLRLVTHPELLSYSSGSTEVTLRVYGYVAGGRMNGSGTHIVDSIAESTVIPEGTVLIKNVAPASLSITAQKLSGSRTVPYAWADAGADMTVAASGSDTLITLLNTPVRHSSNTATGQGLHQPQRLYGLEYVPCETVGSTSFDHTVTATGTLVTPGNQMKNTARWMIKIERAGGGALPNGMYTFETRIGANLTAESTLNSRSNLSRTYAWVGVTPPVTEQYQFMGDARHLPYVDVKTNHGYNWYFRRLTRPSGFNKTAVNGWQNSPNGSPEVGELAIDLPRYLQLIREGLLKTGGLFSNNGGFAVWWYGMGGDIVGGDDGTLDVWRMIYDPSASVDQVRRADEVHRYGSSTAKGIHYIAKTDRSWVSLPWIGELYPDNQFATWQSVGNLSSGSGNFYRAQPIEFPAALFNVDAIAVMQNRGLPTLLNATQDGGSTAMNQLDFTVDATLTTAGSQIASALNLTLPSPLQATRGLNLSNSGAINVPMQWSDSIYSSVFTTPQRLRSYYDSVSLDTSVGLLQIRNAIGAGYFLVNGLFDQNQFVSARMVTTSLATTLRGILDSGDPSIATGRVPQVPLVVITSPDTSQGVLLENPTTIPVTWTLQWKRWDNAGYTENYPNGFAETVPVTYNLKYSPDSGKSWFFVGDGAAATAGVENVGRGVLTPYTWDLSGMPRGTYILRLEAFRQNLPMHYAYHQALIQVDR